MRVSACRASRMFSCPAGSPNPQAGAIIGDMYEWSTMRGFSWGLSETNKLGSELTWSVQYGSLDEPATEAGTLRHVAALIRASLTAPVELPGQGVGIADVDCSLSPDETCITLRGPYEVVAAAWHRFTEGYSDVATLAVDAPLPAPGAAWAEDWIYRTGLTDYTVGDLFRPTPDMPTRAAALLEKLHPATTPHRTVFTTTDERLLGQGFTRAAGHDFRPPHSYIRPDGDGLAQLPGAPATMILSARSPFTGAGLIAPYVWLRTAELALEEVGLKAELINAGAVPVGTDLIVHMTTTQALTEQALMHVLDRLILNPKIPSDYLIDMALAAGGQQIESSRHAFATRLRGLPDLQVPTAHQLRAALAMMAETAHIRASLDTPLPGFTQVDVSHTEPQRGKSYRTRIPPASDPKKGAFPSRVILGDETITLDLKFLQKTNQRYWSLPLRDIGVLGKGPGSRVILIDNRGQIMQFHAASMKNGQELVDELTRRLPHAAVTEDPQPEPEVEEFLKKANFQSLVHRVIGAIGVLMILFIIIMAITGH